MPALTKEEKQAVDDGIARVNRLKRTGDIDGLLDELKIAEPRVPMRAIVLLALGKVGDARAADRIIPLLESENPNERLDAVVALGRIGTDNVEAPLLGALDDRVADVRIKAADAVGDLGVEPARAKLLALLEADDCVERCSAARALSKLGIPEDTPRLRATRAREGLLRRRHFPRRVRARD